MNLADDSIQNKYSRNIAMIAYTEYSRDGRVKREAEAAVCNGFNVDVFVLKEKTITNPHVINDVNIYPLNHWKYAGESNFKYILSYFIFSIKIFGVITKFYFKKKYPLIHVNNMPDFLVFSTLIPKIFGTKIILDIHDSMPELYAAKFQSGSTKLLIKLLKFEERFSAWFANTVITVHEPYKNDILAAHGIPLKKIHVVANFADRVHFTNNKYNTINRNNNLIKLIFHGTIAERFGVDIVLLGLKKVLQKRPQIIFNIYGNGDYFEQIVKLVDELELRNNVILHGYITLSEIPDKIAESDIGIVSQKPSRATDYMLPAKLMEYVSMELPVITIENTVIKYYFNNDELLFYEANSSDSFADKLLLLIEHKSIRDEYKNKMKAVNARLNWEIEKDKLINIYKNLIN